MLETSCAIYMGPISEERGDGVVEATFEMDDVFYMDDSCKVAFGSLSGAIDLRRTAYLHAQFTERGGRRIELDARSAHVIAAVNWMAILHPKIHAFANWSVNTVDDVPFIRRCAVVTVAFNYFGWEGTPRVFELLRAAGVCRAGGSDVQIGHGPIGLPPAHAHIRRYEPYSEYVRFLLRTREHFLREFAHHRLDFPGVDGEALFIGTVRGPGPAPPPPSPHRT
jgi:hypothetical protein